MSVDSSEGARDAVSENIDSKDKKITEANDWREETRTHQQKNREDTNGAIKRMWTPELTQSGNRHRGASKANDS